MYYTVTGGLHASNLEKQQERQCRKLSTDLLWMESATFLANLNKISVNVHYEAAMSIYALFKLPDSFDQHIILTLLNTGVPNLTLPRSVSLCYCVAYQTLLKTEGTSEQTKNQSSRRLATVL